MRAADAVHDDPAVVPDVVYWAAEYEADVHWLRRLGCRCPLRCEVYSRRGVFGSNVRALPLNDVVAATCPVDHVRS